MTWTLASFTPQKRSCLRTSRRIQIRSKKAWLRPDSAPTRFGPDQIWLRPDSAPTTFGSDQIRLRPDSAPTRFASDQTRLRPDSAPTRFGSDRIRLRPDSAPTRFGSHQIRLRPDAAPTRFGFDRIRIRPKKPGSDRIRNTAATYIFRIYDQSRNALLMAIYCGENVQIRIIKKIFLIDFMR
jgi:hypothetical protein